METVARIGRRIHSLGRYVHGIRSFSLRLVRGDALLLVSMLLVVGCVWAFIEVADEVTEQRTLKIDQRVMRALRDPADPSQPVGPRWLKGAMRDVTALGSAVLLFLFVFAVIGVLLVRHQYHAIPLVLVATFGGRLLNDFLKWVFARPRPDLSLHLTEVASPSFPSGHAMDSAVIYLTLAALLARLVRPRALKLYFLGLAALLSFLAGISRVYLGVHYPTDVLAGWTAGLGWALFCWTAASYLQRRGSVEQAK
jgi:undecaprenyl-diphosphatase